MKVAIIGSGNVGKALAGSATRAGHKVTMAASDPAHAEEAAKATKAHAARSNQDAVKDAELVVLAVPANKVDEVVGGLAQKLDGKVIIDVTNRVNPKDPGQVLDGSSTAERIQKQAPKSHVVKAFNYAFASKMADPMVDGTRLDAYVAGDDAGAKQKALEFAESIGFRPVDAGPLAMARALEAMAMLNILLQIQNNWPWQSGWKLAGPTGGDE
ncbi:MAG: prephenate dehydrogenase/arogenate dehydrogenase family protein [Chloroflexi bacterium]|nr:MAG: prephenate dehydrogenase/arogenate dehydrogenase family protein [Chloroflexota bacterium]TMF35138.1 MAG: prephenate dehydrogenase/arogenate dehydrogenase family protein [Chloroflexota bacterium]